jgi:hypothetical protein
LLTCRAQESLAVLILVNLCDQIGLRGQSSTLEGIFAPTTCGTKKKWPRLIATFGPIWAVDIGCSGIVVSNHGGRQLDGSRSSFDQLAEIVDAVGDKIDVLMDGGVQRGTMCSKPSHWAPRR